MKDAKGLYYAALASLLITWILFINGYAVSTSDNDQVQPAGKDYVNEKSVRPSCVCVASDNVSIKKHKVHIYIYIYVYIHIYIYISNWIIGYIHMQLCIQIQQNADSY